MAGGCRYHGEEFHSEGWKIDIFQTSAETEEKNFALPTGPELFPQKKAGTWRLLTATQIRDEQANERMKNAVQSFLWDWDFEMDDERVMD